MQSSDPSSTLYSILYSTDKHKKSKKWHDGLLSYTPSTQLAKFLEEGSHVCFYKKILPGGVTVGEELVTGMYIVQIDHEITSGKENIATTKSTTNVTSVNASTNRNTNNIKTTNTGNKVKSIVASECVPLEGRSNDELLALLNQNSKPE